MMQNRKLDLWLQKATRCLAADSAAQVRREIQEHYESAHEAAIKTGATSHDADDTAIQALGSPKLANRQYRKVLLTSTEARMLRLAQRESSAVCARSRLVWLLRAVTVGGLVGAGIAFLSGQDKLAKLLLIIGVGNGVFTASTLISIRTPTGSRIFRSVKWAAILLVSWIMFGPDSAKWVFGVMVCFGTLVWTEWTYYSIRRKLPVSDWPRALFF